MVTSTGSSLKHPDLMTELPTKTSAAILLEIGKPLEIMELNLPALKPGQVLVDVDHAGICHTQLHEVRGRRGPDKFLPHALGHEGAGTVLSVGQGVNKVKAGDKVVMTWIKASGMDVPSCTYDSAIGPINSGAISTFMTVSITSENRLVPISDYSLQNREACLLGCAVPTGVGVVMNSAKVKPDSSVAVFGVGGIGLSAILGARMRGAEIIIAVDIIEQKLSKALQAGATHTINATEGNVAERISQISKGRGVDSAIEAVGKPEAMESAFASIAYGGGVCVLAGNVPYGETIKLDPYDLIKGRRIIGSWGGETIPDRDIPFYAEMFLSGKLPFDQLVSHEWRLEDINIALDELEAGRVSRALINLKK